MRETRNERIDSVPWVAFMVPAEKLVRGDITTPIDGRTRVVDRVSVQEAVVVVVDGAHNALIFDRGERVPVLARGSAAGGRLASRVRFDSAVSR